MKKYLLIFCLTVLAVSVSGQKQDAGAGSNKAVAQTSSATAQAKATLAAHGGEKLVNMKSLVLRGSAELTAESSSQTIPAAFAIVQEGKKFRFDIQSPFFNFQQIFDGRQHFSSVGGFNFPIDKTGLGVLVNIDQPGFAVSDLPEKFKKKKGFRLTTPEGFYTDFIIDEKTNQVKEFESSYEVNGYELTTSVAVDKYREVEGVLVNEKFSQRLQTRQGTFYAGFKAKDILINSDVGADVFVLPK